MLLRRKSQGASIAIVALLTLLACSSGSDSKLGLVAKNRGNSDQELERLRKMQLVRVIERDEATGKLEFHEKSPERVEADLIDQCAQEINDTTKFDEFDPLCPALTTAGCSERACAASLAGCAAHLALEIASIRAAPVSIDFHIDRNPDPDNPDPSLVEDAHYQIPPQSSATNAALAKMAMELARNAMAHGSDALRSVFDPGVDCQSADLSQPVLDGRTIGSILSTTYAEAFNTYREATLKAVDFNLAVADSQRTDTSLERGVGRSVAGAELSRVAAAHLAVGGPAGLAGTMDGAPRAGLCSAPELSGPAQQALSALRESGVSPAAILAIPGQAPSGVTAIPIGTLLNGTAKQIAGGSVRQRLSEIWGYDFDHPPAGVPASQTVPQYLRLQDQDFVEARNYLAQEIIAFSRSSVAQTRPARAAGAKPSGACATMANPNAFCDSYVATAQPPSDRPDAYWSAIVRDHGARLGDVIGTAPILGDQTDFADTIDAALTFAGLLLQNETNLDTSLRSAVMNPMAVLASGQDRLGKLTFCGSPSANDYTAYLDGFDSTSNLRIMLGEDGLMCAAGGSVEGADCNDTVVPHTVAPQYYYIKSFFGIAPAEGFTRASVGSSTTPPPEGQRIYVVRRKPSYATDAPGAFDVLTAYRFVGADYPSDQTTCYVIPIVPEAEQLAGRIMHPSKRWCSSPRVSCAGTEFDARMPLEDELTKDSDGVESSWKHYLTLAQQAAAEADQIGQTYLQSAIDLDTRQETQELQEADRQRIAQDRAVSAVEDLQTICGTTVDPVRLLKLLQNGTEDKDLDFFRKEGSQCFSDDTCNPGVTDTKLYKFTCIANRCVADLRGLINNFANDSTIRPDLERLQRCLDDSTIKDFVHLGRTDLPLCLWHEPDNKRAVCVGKGPEQPCPVFANHRSGDQPDQFQCDALHPPAGKTKVLVDAGLGLIDTLSLPSDVYTSTGRTSVCDAIRAKRSGTPLVDRVTDSRSIQSDPRFELDAARNLSRRIGFTAAYGGYGSITVDGVPLYSTGNAWSGPGTKWPCNGAGRQGCPGPGLFCASGNGQCNMADVRASLNDRMLNAVLALRAASLDPRFGSGTIVYPSVVPEQICEGGTCTTLDLGAPSGRILSEVNFEINELTNGSYGRVFQVLAPASGNATARRAYRYRLPGSFQGYVDFDTNSLLGSATVPPRYSGNMFAAFRPVDLSFAESAVTAGGYSIGNPASLWRCLRGGADCAPLDTNGGNCPTPPPDCEDKIKVVNGKEVKTGQICTPVSVPCNKGYFVAALSDTSTQAPPPLAVKARLFGAVTTDPQKPGNPATDPDATIPLFGNFSKSGMLDGLELLCEVVEAGASIDRTNTLTPCGFAPEIKTVDDLPRTADFLGCAGNEILKGAGKAVLSEFPVDALDPLRNDPSAGAFPSAAGDVGVNVSELRSALLELAQLPILIAGETATIANNIEAVNIAANAKNIKEQIAGIQLQAQEAQRETECLIANSPTISVTANVGLNAGTSIGVSFNPVAGALTCMNGDKQNFFSELVTSLTKNLDDITLITAMNQFSQQFAESQTRMSGYSLRMKSAVETIDRDLTLIKNQRSKAKRALARAMYVDSFESKFQATINAAMWKRFLIDAQRYKDALRTAQKMAFLAKRAIEMRLGVNLADMTDDLPLVPAPHLWEANACTTVGIDVSNFTAGTSSVPTGPTIGSQIDPTMFQFEDPFIGDYVRKLGLVVESYRLKNAFHEGTDTSVISLRDDVKNVRAMCDVPVNNLVLRAGALSTAPTPDAAGWERSGCSTTAGDVANCIGTFEEENPPLFNGIPALAGDAKAFRLHFGTGYQSGAALVQKVVVPPGIYRASAYMYAPTGEKVTAFDPTTTGMGHPNNDKGLLLRVSGASDPTGGGVISETQPSTVIADCTADAQCATGQQCFGNVCQTIPMMGAKIPATGASWARVYKVINVQEPTTLDFGFARPTVSGQGLNEVIVAGPMLESLARFDSSVPDPAPFANTTQVRSRQLPQCQDTFGVEFQKVWKPGSARLCSDGFTGECSGEEAKQFDYWETTFSLNQADIEAGRILGNAGFARGNFNYRIESIAVNFVGTGIHDCANAALPSTCFAAGFVPFTLVHDGPYFIRNHQGQDFQLDLFPGRIENARGLATERYVTNPLSTADHALVDQYLRTEFQGRPLDGNFVLRVWNTPGLVFNSIQDVQLILHYRYWTRFQ